MMCTDMSELIHIRYEEGHHVEGVSFKMLNGYEVIDRDIVSKLRTIKELEDTI